MSHPVSFDTQGDIAVVTIDHPPVNALSLPVRQGIDEAIGWLNREEALKAAILICAGRTFIAGADITEFGKPPVDPITPDLMLIIARSAKPIIAALHGTVLGGGFETALACHYRVALAGTRVGFPEVTLGLLPGAGGTQLLPRLAGTAAALDLITSGRQVDVSSDLGQRLVDEVVDGDTREALLQAAFNAGRHLVDSGAAVRQLADVVLAKDDQHDALFAQWREKMAKKNRGQLAVQHAINSIENSVQLPFDEALAEERRLFQACRESSQSRAMRHAFFAERRCAKIEHVDDSAQPRSVEQVAVIGAGLMGVGIAICFANAGIPVVLLELDQAKVEAGLKKIRSNYERQVSRGRMEEAELAKRCDLVSGTTEYADLADVDLVVEAAFESLDVKNAIFTELDAVCKPDAILASNTSYLDIDQIAQVTRRPEQVVGMHFFSPAHIMKLLEVVRATATSDDVLLTIVALGKRLKKIPVTVRVCYGFAGNRIYARYGAEAQKLLLEGATPEQVDSAFRDWGMAMGPLQVVDLTGLEIGYKARKHQPNLPDDPTYFALSTVFVEEGRIGQKSGAGFYRYEDGQRLPDDGAIALIRDTAAQLGIEQRSFAADEICRRLVSAIVDEGRAVLDEGIVQRASDIDVIWLNGYGFPRYRGGPMWYADEEGL